MIDLPPTTLEWTDAERLAWEPPADLSVSQWADTYRILHPLTSAEPGQWRTNRTPYLAGIMDAFSDSAVEKITVMASTQVGKTEAILNMVAYAIDQDPGSALLVMPREEDVVSIGQRRIRPMVEASPQLSRHLSESKADNKLKEIRFSRSMLYFAGSNSPADLASRSIRYLFCDEVDKYPAFSGREADPISLAEERTRTHPFRKIVHTSTPTTRNGYIFREYERSDQRMYFVPCPSCGEHQHLEFAQVKWPEDVRDPVVIREGRLAWYECEHCGHKINDLDKQGMLQAGEWRSTNTTESNRHAGFRIHALYSPWLTFSEVAAKFLEAHGSGDQGQLLNFVNSYLGWIWEERSEQIDVEQLETKAAGYSRGTVPDDAVVLTAGVDVQGDGVSYYVVRAWGLREESWLVECGRLEGGLGTLVPVLLTRTWQNESGTTQHPARLICIDSGFNTDEVYRFARKHAERVRPIKGSQRLNGVPLKSNRIDKTVAGTPIKNSVRLWHVDTTHFKDKVSRLMNAQAGEHGEWHLHDAVPAEYLRQVTSEHKVLNRNRRTGATTSEWTKKPGSSANHWWDCEIYATAAADMVAVYALQKATEQPKPVPTPTHSNQPQEQQWNPKRSGWLNG